MVRDRGKHVGRTARDDSTLAKVYFGLANAGVTGQQAIDAVNQMQNEGILFRELSSLDFDAVYELCEAIRLTAEYVGTDVLQAIEGWSWYDALKKYRPDMLKEFEG